MAKAKVKKKNSALTARSVETRIVGMSLQHPELGARRLVPLLKKKRISVSAATIQNILRRHGLQNRERRLAQVNKRALKAPKPKPPSKKPSTRIADEVAEHICEISLQNPDLGAKSLAPLLKEKGISVSSSAVYRILKHHELHTRAKRCARAPEISREPVIIPKTFSEKIPPGVEDRIVGISLQNPEYGARGLLPLLQQEEIFVSLSAVYRILKRHELENRKKRFLRLEARLDLEAITEAEAEIPELLTEALEIESKAAGDGAPEPVIEPAVAHHVSFTAVDKAPASAEELEPIAESGETVPVSFADEAPEPEPEPSAAGAAEDVESAAPAEPERPLARKAHLNLFKIRSHPAFYPLYLLLLVLIGYLGFQAFQTIQHARSETGFVSVAEPAAGGIVAKVEIAASGRPLMGYRRIWERNLFNIALKEDSGSEKEIVIEEVAPAGKDLGLKLVGTVMADDAGLRRAFIDNSKTRGQKAYREGDAAGKVRIKKILRNRVIVSTVEGDRLLMVDIGGATEGGATESLNAAPYAQQIPAGVEYPQQIAGRRPPGRSFKLARQEVEASLADIDKLEQQLDIEPYMKDDQPAGFTIGSIPPESILRKMGLKSGNAITGINDEAITSPEQAAEFFQTLAQGGEKTIKARIGRGVRSRTRYFHLIIE